MKDQIWCAAKFFIYVLFSGSLTYALTGKLPKALAYGIPVFVGFGLAFVLSRYVKTDYVPLGMLVLMFLFAAILLGTLFFSE